MLYRAQLDLINKITVASGIVLSMSIYLADVSEFQPDIDDATYVKWSHGIMIRALYGDAHVDGAWYGGARRADLHAAGIRFLGIYQYLVSGQSGTAQAQAFHNLVGPIRNGEVFVADFEEGSKSMLTAWYNEMIALYGAGITNHLWTYTGLNFGRNAGVLPVQWLADYSSTEPSSPHTLWQFTDSFNVPGVGTCDCNRYNGTINQLASLGWGGSSQFHVNANAPGRWRGQATITGTGTNNKTYYTATADGKHWSAPSQSEPKLSGSATFYVSSNAPGWWKGTIVLAGNGTDGNRWHTSTDDGLNWSTPRK
jgi:GH25 family lysozyme M1 (1,4-beta-N-acetylmuramidase)